MSSGAPNSEAVGFPRRFAPRRPLTWIVRWQREMSLIDLIAELGTLDPWLYRGWLYLLSPRYRSARHDAWKSSGLAYAIGDVILSVTIMLAEIIAVVLIGSWIIGIVGASS